MSAYNQIALLGRRAGLTDSESEALAEQLLGGHRAEVLAEAKTEIITYLSRKAREHRSAGGQQHAVQAEFVFTLASKIQRGAVRIFLDATETTATPHPIPLAVSRFDTAIEPAPEEEPVLTVGCIAEDGTPVALLLDPEARAKVGRWLLPEKDMDDRLGRLADHILDTGGEWTTGKAHQWLLAEVDPGVSRHRARHALQHLAALGYLAEHDRDGRRSYTLNYPKAATE
jgi:hypothetical protein